MANDNQIDFKVRLQSEGVSELAGGLKNIDESAKDLAQAATAAGAGVDRLESASKDAGDAVSALGTDAKQAQDAVTQLAAAEDAADDQARGLGTGSKTAADGVKGVGQAATVAAVDLGELAQAVDAKTKAIKAGLQVEQSEIELQRQHLVATQAEQQARLKAAQARGDEKAAAEATNAIIRVEADQSQLLAQRLRAEATAIQAAADARREQLAAVGPLTQAQQAELKAIENQAKALRVQAAAADSSAQQSRELGGAFQQLDQRSQKLNTELTSVAKAIGGLFAAVNVVQFAKDAITTADAYGQMAERIQMASNGTAEYELVQKRLLETANLTYRPLVEQQEMYIQTAAALRSLSYTTRDVLDITDSFSYLLTTNAASADKGRSAIDAYSKSIQTGKVEADSWTSIMSAMPTIVDAIAVSTGKTASEIRNLGVTGALSIADLNEGLRQTVEKNKELAAGMSATVKDAVTRLSNTWSVYLGEANKAHKSTDQIVKLIDTLSANLDSVVRAATAVGEVMVVVWALKALGALKAYTAQLVLATKETQALMVATSAGGVKMGAALKAAGNVALSGWIGWEIGTYLKSEFQVVEQAGVALAAGLTMSAARAQAGWEMAKAAFSSDTIEAAQQRLQVRLRQIDDEYAQLFVAADRAAKKQDEQGKSTTAAADAAKNATVQWENLRTSYETVTKEVEAMAAQVEKTATLRNAEAAASTAMAQAFGTEREQRVAATQAAEVQAEQSLNIAKQRQLEVEVLKAERDALVAIGEELVKTNPEKKKQLDDLNKQIALREADAGAATAQAAASKVAAAAAQAEQEAYKDNSARLGELRDAYERTKAKLEEVRAAKAAGKATTEDVTKAELEAGKAALVYRDALQDQMRAIEAKRNLQLTDLDVQSATIRLAMEQQQRIYEVAKARGDERGAIAAQNEIRRLEIELLTLTAQAKRIEADAAIASAQAKRAELISKGEYNGAQKLEIEAAIKAAEVKRLEGDIAETTANKLRDLANVQGNLRGSTDSATSAIDKQASAMERLADGVERVGEGYRNKDGMTSDAKGNVQQQFVWTQSSIIEYLKSAGLEDAVAESLSKQFLNGKGEVDYLANDAQKRWAGEFGTLAEALGKVAEYYKYNDSGKHERAAILDYETSKNAKPVKATSATSTTASTSTASGGNTYVSNITLPNGSKTTVKFADAESQSAAEQLLRDLAAGKGVVQ